MNSDDLLVEQRGAVATVTMNRPEIHNAFDGTLIGAITEVFKQLGADDTVRVVVLVAAGRSFSAGADLTWMGRMVGYSRDENVADARRLQQMFAVIAECPKVTIARVQGAAMGGGVGLVAASDIAVAAESTFFAFSEVRLGIIPSIIAPYVIEKVGVGAARALFVTGRRFGAAEALRIGLVQEVIPEGDLDTAVDRAVNDALQAGPEAVSQVKNLLRAIARQTTAEAAEETVARIADLRVSPEGQEGIRAFLNKRKPSWHLE